MLNNTPAELPRMPLEPIRPPDGREDSAYGSRMKKYQELLAEADRLWELQSNIEEAQYLPGDMRKAPTIKLADYNAQLAAYQARREAYIAAHDGFLETYEMVCEKIRTINATNVRPKRRETFVEPPEFPDIELLMTDRAAYDRQYAEYEQQMAAWHQSLDSSIAEAENEFKLLQCVMKECSKFKRIEDEFEIRLKNTHIRSRIVSYDEKDVERLMATEGIIRNRAKLRAVVTNTRVCLNLCNEFGSFGRYVESFVGTSRMVEPYTQRTTSPVSDALSSDMRRRGMKFVGSTTVYAFLQAAGFIDAHGPECDLGKRGRA